MKTNLFVAGLFVLASTAVQAQTFSSGSTGADGPASCYNTAVTWQVPPSGVFNFTTVTITGCNVFFTPNQRNTPVIILAEGNVTLSTSSLYLYASGQTPGPGGYFGGASGQTGFGPGGGAPGQNGQWVGPLSLVPLIGGSGGGGPASGAGLGGGGGGAIVIASSSSIECTGTSNGIVATGETTVATGAGRGAGGAIRLVANSVSGNCQLRATGGVSTNPGLIRIEAPVGGLNYTGTSTPPAVLSTINPTIIPISTTAALTVASIGGFPVPSDAGTRPGTVDVVLPRSLTDPISVAVQGRNIPVGTAVNLNLSGSTGVTYTPGSLAGSLELSTATLLVNGLNRTAETHLFVYATFDVPEGAAALNLEGPDQVARIRVEGAPGKPSTTKYLRKDGSEIDPKEIPAGLVAYLSSPKH